MNIDEIRDARRDMEIAITKAAIEAVDTFRTKTGLSPDGISIYMADVTGIGDRERRYTVGDVRSSVPL